MMRFCRTNLIILYQTYSAKRAAQTCQISDISVENISTETSRQPQEEDLLLNTQSLHQCVIMLFNYQHTHHIHCYILKYKNGCDIFLNNAHVRYCHFYSSELLQTKTSCSADLDSYICRRQETQTNSKKFSTVQVVCVNRIFTTNVSISMCDDPCLEEHQGLYLQQMKMMRSSDLLHRSGSDGHLFNSIFNDCDI